VIISFDRGRLDEFRWAVREVGQRLVSTPYTSLRGARIELIDVAPEGSTDW